jgi:Spy/CpxP family protein refolding chaperone
MSTPRSETNQSSQPLSRTRRRRFIATSAIAILATVIAGTTLVLAHEKDWHQGPAGHVMPGEHMAAHLKEHVAHVLATIDVTDQQKAQITSILQAVERDMQPAQEQHGAMHQQLSSILLAPTIDRARLETLRGEHLRRLDEACGRALTALADIAEVLTPEQRSTLAAKMQAHHQVTNELSHPSR